jgi:NADH dehydrogenase (ubiquinone) 1 alpha subcomplex subunit 8
MVFTNADWLPTYDELTVPEIELSSAPLRAAAHHFGKYCDEQSKEFMLCYQEEKDPRKCVNEGKEVTRCGLEFFKKVKVHCAEEFTEYWKCIDRSGHDMNFKPCRATQKIFDGCILDKLGQERPGPGYFSKARVHHTKRPEPSKDIILPEAIPETPTWDRKDPAPPSTRLGARWFF